MMMYRKCKFKYLVKISRTYLQLFVFEFHQKDNIDFVEYTSLPLEFPFSLIHYYRGGLNRTPHRLVY